jgi:signal transduction histidine kinase
VEARRALLLVMDEHGHTMRVARAAGVDVEPAVAARVPLDEDGHPFVVCALALQPVLGVGDALPALRPSMERWIALPLPQPLFRGSPGWSRDRGLTFAAQYAGSEVLAAGGTSRRPRYSRAPFGVLVVESHLDPARIDALVALAGLAGPILARMHSVDALQRAAAALDQQRSLLTTIVDALPDPVVITDTANNVILQNGRAEHLLSIGETDSEGRRRAVEINNLLFSSFLSKAMMTGGGVQTTGRELNLVDPDEGTDLLFEVLVHPLAPPVVSAGAYLSVLRDVTDLKRASAELERQFQRLRLTESEATRERDRLDMILSNVGDPILVTDDQSKIILMNPQAERLFDPPPGSADRLATQRVRGNDTKFTTLIADFALSPAMYRREQVALTQPESGTELPVEVVSGKITNERGEPMAIVSVLHDLTKHVENERLYEALKRLNAELEDRIRRATADLEAQNLKLQWQASELEKAYRLKSEFLANMSHELRTPINALIGYTSIMLERIYGELTPQQVEGLHRIRSASHHLLALINDILDLAKIEAGKMPVHLERVSLVPTIDEVTTQIEPMVRAKALEFRREVAPDPPVMTTDPTKIKQILLNLLSNAVKFTHRGWVSLRVRSAGDAVEIEVADSGIGIRREHLDVIWEEFRQGDQSRTREYGGTGLGLSITRKLVALLGGTISVTSEVGAGSVFRVLLPATSEPLTADEQVTRAAIGLSPPSVS